MENHHRIKLRNTVFAQSEYRATPLKFSGTLAAAHAEGLRALCLCNYNSSKLYIAHKVGSYYLARMPNTGPDHHPDCCFYESPLDDTGRSGYAESAIIDKNGLFDVKLGVPLVKNRERADRAIDHISTQSLKKRSSVELLGLLHFLWERSSNHVWFPSVNGKAVSARYWAHVNYFLKKSLPAIRVKGRPISELLLVLSAFDKKNPDGLLQEFTTFLSSVVASGSSKAISNGDKVEMKLVLGEVKLLQKSKYGYELKFRGLNRTLFLSEALYRKAANSYPSSIAALTKDGLGKAVGLTVISASETGNLHIENLALMRVTDNYIPVDSSFEKLISDKLIAEGRLFEKPLKYDNEEMTLPDFVLLDSSIARRVPMEVYGMTGNADYDRRKSEKKAIYSNSGQAFWDWTPNEIAVPPAFPEKRQFNEQQKAEHE